MFSKLPKTFYLVLCRVLAFLYLNMVAPKSQTRSHLVHVPGYVPT